MLLLEQLVRVLEQFVRVLQACVLWLALWYVQFDSYDAPPGVMAGVLMAVAVTTFTWGFFASAFGHNVLMAAATGVPLVALHGPSSPHRWGPVSKNAIVVEPPLRGCGFLNLGFEKLRNAQQENQKGALATGPKQ